MKKSVGKLLVFISFTFLLFGISNVKAWELNSLNEVDSNAVGNAYLSCCENLSEGLNVPYNQTEYNAVEDYIELYTTDMFQLKFIDNMNQYVSDIPDYQTEVNEDYLVTYANVGSDRVCRLYFFYTDNTSYTRYLMPSREYEVGEIEFNIIYKNNDAEPDASIKNLLDEKIEEFNSNNESVIVEFDYDKDYRFEGMDLSKNIFGDNPNQFSASRLNDPYSASYHGRIEHSENGYVTFGHNGVVYDRKNMDIRFLPKVYIPQNYKTDEEIKEYVRGIFGPYVFGFVIYDMIFNANRSEINMVVWEKEQEQYFDSSYIGNYGMELPNHTYFMDPYVNNRIRICTDYVEGDLDRNGVVDANDASIALELYKAASASKNDITIGDMDHNNIIDANDASLILELYKNNN